MSEKRLGWGIVATGGIASKFAEDLEHVAGAQRAAVCSRSRLRAETFAERYGFAHAHDELGALLADPLVDIVYIASPNVAHADQALEAIAAGKPVVIEKPMAMTAADARRVADTAGKAGVFAMEALWTRFLPAVQRAKALVDDGLIGEVLRAEAELAFPRGYDPKNRLFDPKLGGGCLYDLGVYPLSLAIMFLGDPDTVEGRWTAAPTGTDMAAEVTLGFGGKSATIRAGFDREGDNAFTLYGAKGVLRIDRHFLSARSVTFWDKPMEQAPKPASGLLGKIARRLPLDGRRVETFDFPGHGLHFEARAAQAAILAGETASAVIPSEQSARVLDIIAAVLAEPPAA